MRAKLFIALAALVAMSWAVPSEGTARFIVKEATQRSDPAMAVPRPARLRVQKDRGLLLSTWINGRGPYVFAVDTGAGMNLITQKVASETHLLIRNVQPTKLGGLSGVTTTSNREAVIDEIGLGDRSNVVHSTRTALVVAFLPSGVDGILDPTDVYAPLGYSIDIPNERIAPLDSSSNIVERSGTGEGASVPWLRSGDLIRPFVRLGDGRLALVDTGSGFGLAVNGRGAVIIGRQGKPQSAEETRDLGGGFITSRRVAPTTISIGELVLRHVPTDILFGVDDDAPVILGREVLYPFKITFDPQRRLIQFTTSRKS
ncbi:MAG TPA: aspartyl protease family protein [Pyrinomonadaceae bacterium]|nr:aspartyl protease family protein [Pyrinomonadaceae bacterium]